MIMNNAGKSVFWVVAATFVLSLSGCKTQMPKPSGFLSDYSRLTEVDDSTWQYIDAAGLAGCTNFVVAPVKIIVTEYLGTAFPEDQKRRLAESFGQKITKAVSAKYHVVSAPSPATGEIRVALTQIYRVGNALAMGAEAEIVNSESHKQLAELSGVKIGPPELGVNTNPRTVKDPSDPSHYVEAWWNRPAADELMDRWAGNLARIIAAGGKK